MSQKGFIKIAVIAIGVVVLAAAGYLVSVYRTPPSVQAPSLEEKKIEETALPIMVDAEPATSTQILSPRAGDVWRLGEVYEIQWVNAPEVFELKVVKKESDNRDGVMYAIAGVENRLPQTGSYSWRVPDLSPGFYQITILAPKTGKEIEEVAESEMFTLVLAEAEAPPAEATTLPALSLALEPSSPSGKVLQGGDKNITLAKVRFAAAGGDVRIHEIIVVSDYKSYDNFSDAINNFLNIRLYDETTQEPVGQSAYLFPETSTSEGVHGTANFTFSKPWVIPNNTTKTLSLLADINQAASTKALGRLGILSLRGDFTLSTNVLPIYGSYMRFDSKVKPSIKTLSPNGDETWRVGETRTIRWSFSGYTPLAKAELVLYDDRYTEAFILVRKGATIAEKIENIGEYTWNIPKTIGEHPNNITLGSGNVYKIGVFLSVGDDNIRGLLGSDLSDARFNITSSDPTADKPHITLHGPNGGEKIKQDEKFMVFFSTENLTSKRLKINLWKGGSFYRELAEIEAPEGTILPATAFINMPKDIPEGTDYTLELSDAADSSFRDISDALFSVIP